MFAQNYSEPIDFNFATSTAHINPEMIFVVFVFSVLLLLLATGFVWYWLCGRQLLNPNSSSSYQSRHNARFIRNADAETRRNQIQESSYSHPDVQPTALTARTDFLDPPSAPPPLTTTDDFHASQPQIDTNSSDKHAPSEFGPSPPHFDSAVDDPDYRMQPSTPPLLHDPDEAPPPSYEEAVKRHQTP